MSRPQEVDPVEHTLRLLPELVLWLEIDLVRATPEPGSNSNKPSSKPPVDLQVVSDLDEAWNCLTTWARDWAETFDYAGPSKATWDGLCSWLATTWPRARDEHPAADDFVDELTHRHNKPCPQPCAEDHQHIEPCQPSCALGWYHVLRRHRENEDRSWQRLPGRWTCPRDTGNGTCGGPLLENVAARRIVCRTCESTWSGEIEYARLGLLLNVEPWVTIEQAAALQRVSTRSVRRWIAKGWLPASTREGVIVVDRLDLALVKARAQT